MIIFITVLWNISKNKIRVIKYRLCHIFITWIFCLIVPIKAFFNYHIFFQLHFSFLFILFFEFIHLTWTISYFNKTSLRTLKAIYFVRNTKYFLKREMNNKSRKNHSALNISSKNPTLYLNKECHLTVLLEKISRD